MVEAWEQERAALRAELEKERKRAARLKARLKRRNSAIKAEWAKVTRYRFGSYTPGISAWEERWDSAPPEKRVLLYAKYDAAGSLMKWGAALNECSEYAARVVAFEQHPFGYDFDLLLPYPSFAESGIDTLIDEAAVIHIKDETGFYLGTNQLPKGLFADTGKPLVFTHYGGFARKHAKEEAYREFVQSFDARIAMTPDLNFPWFNGKYIPHAMDTRGLTYSWRDGRRLAHSPSIRSRKGTETLLRAIDGLPVEFELIEGVSHSECVARKRQASLFFDQAGREQVEALGTDRVIGWYANSALEAAVHGIPTIAHLSEEAFEGAARAGKHIRERCPVINTPLDGGGMRAVIENYFQLDPEERRELSKRTRRWVEDFHSYEVTAGELGQLYDTVCAQKAGSLQPRVQ